VIRWVIRRQLPDGYPVDEHFNPPYDPWDQRLCAVPDGDLFAALRSGTASIVTDRIISFTEAGVLLQSGRQLEADVIVTATGLNAQALGGLRLTVDGEPVNLPDTVAYKGMMLSGVPNLAFAVGYTNASWTLKVDLVCEHFCRLLAHMDAGGHDICQPQVAGPMATRPLLDLTAGYVQRAVDQLPRQGDRAPWLTSSDYRSDVRLLRGAAVADPELHLARTGADAALGREPGSQPADRGCASPGVR
jgi:cation diffusion facilitator CzcD-associated flavoprotein CzcO